MRGGSALSLTAKTTQGDRLFWQIYYLDDSRMTPFTCWSVLNASGRATGSASTVGNPGTFPGDLTHIFSNMPVKFYENQWGSRYFF